MWDTPCNVGPPPTWDLPQIKDPGALPGSTSTLGGWGRGGSHPAAPHTRAGSGPPTLPQDWLGPSPMGHPPTTPVGPFAPCRQLPVSRRHLVTPPHILCPPAVCLSTASLDPPPAMYPALGAAHPHPSMSPHPGGTRHGLSPWGGALGAPRSLQLAPVFPPPATVSPPHAHLVSLPVPGGSGSMRGSGSVRGSGCGGGAGVPWASSCGGGSSCIGGSAVPWASGGAGGSDRAWGSGCAGASSRAGGVRLCRGPVVPGSSCAGGGC